MERFFLIGCQIDEIELKELLLRRYHTLTFEMDFWEFVEFVNLALETEKKEKAERLYLELKKEKYIMIWMEIVMIL